MIQNPSERGLPVHSFATKWLVLSAAAALLSVVGNVIALSCCRVYAGLSPDFLSQAIAQDLANLGITAPLWFLYVFLALRGSLRAYLSWLGILVFTVYNYVIYAFSIPFGPLFLLWVAVLGLSAYSLAGGIIAVKATDVASRFSSPRAVHGSAWTLIVVAVLFSALWLSEDIPPLLSGEKPLSLAVMGTPTNPVHVLDLAFFLPAALGAGVLLLKRRSFGFVAAPAMLLFLILTSVPILITPAVQTVLGGEPVWRVAAVIGALMLALICVFSRLLGTLRRSPYRSVLQSSRA